MVQRLYSGLWSCRFEFEEVRGIGIEEKGGRTYAARRGKLESWQEQAGKEMLSPVDKNLTDKDGGLHASGQSGEIEDRAFGG